MQRKQNALKSLMRAGVCAALALGTFAVQAADPSGVWKWNAPGRGGNPGPEITLTLKADGAKLTGNLSRPGRGGGDPAVTDISNGKIDGDKISFDLVNTNPNSGMSTTNSYEGTIAGDTIKGTQPAPRGRGRGRGGFGGPGGPGGAPGGPGMAPADTSTPPPAPPARPEWVATRSK